MEKARGRRAAIAAVALGVLTLAAAAFALKDRAIEAWYIRKLYRSSGEGRLAAARRLAKLGLPRGADAVAGCAWAHVDGMAEVLASWSRPIPPWAIECLTNPLAFKDPAIWEHGFQILEKAGPPAAPALARMLAQATAWQPRLLAAILLGRVRDPGDAVPALAAALRDPDLLVRIAAARALARLGPAARGAIPDLEAAVASDTIHVRVPAWRALERIRGEQPATIRELVRDRKGPYEKPVPRLDPFAPPPPVTAATVLPETDRDAAIARLRARSERAGDAIDAFATALAAAGNYLNPQLNPVFGGVYFKNLAGADRLPMHVAWLALFEELDCQLGDGEQRRVFEAMARGSAMRVLLVHDAFADFPGQISAGSEEMRFWEDEEEPIMDALEAEDDFIFRELVADLREGLAAENFARLAAFLRSLGFPVDG